MFSKFMLFLGFNKKAVPVPILEKLAPPAPEPVPEVTMVPNAVNVPVNTQVPVMLKTGNHDLYQSSVTGTVYLQHLNGLVTQLQDGVWIPCPELTNLETFIDLDTVSDEFVFLSTIG